MNLTQKSYRKISAQYFETELYEILKDTCLSKGFRIKVFANRIEIQDAARNIYSDWDLAVKNILSFKTKAQINPSSKGVELVLKTSIYRFLIFSLLLAIITGSTRYLIYTDPFISIFSGVLSGTVLLLLTCIRATRKLNKLSQNFFERLE